MQPKRRAAANVFMEQNVPQPSGVANERDQRADSLPMVPAPSVSGSEFAAFAPAPQARSLSHQYTSKTQATQDGLKTSEELQLEKEPIRVRETGIWPFKRVIVPPNVYVVHTRIGR